MTIRAPGWDGQYDLIDKATGQGIRPGDFIQSFRGEIVRADHWQAPHKPGASGKVNGFYASVFDLKWKKVEE